MSWLSIGVAVGGAALSAGTAALSASNAPKQPDIGSSSAALSDLNAQMLPWRRKLEAAAATGGKVTIDDYPPREELRDVYYVKPEDVGESSKMPRPGVFGAIGFAQHHNDKIAVPAYEFEPGGKYAGYPKPPDNAKVQEKIWVSGPKTFDFTGVGNADANAAVAKATAEAQLALQQKYGVEFAKSNAEQQKIADPEGYAARQKMNDLIQGQINRTPDRTIANTLDSQISGQLEAGKGLTPESQAMLDDAVRRAGNDRGGGGVSADFSDPLTMGFAGQARQQAAIGKAGGWLASGLTPQDADYRREQQNIANLSGLVNGQTPESQFSGLSAPGPTPFQNTAGPQMPTNTHAGAQNAIAGYGAQVAQQQQQVNPWMAGLSGLLSAGNAWASNRQTAPKQPIG